MKFLVQTPSQQLISKSDSESNILTPSEQNNSKKETQNIKFTSQNHCQIQQLRINVNDPQNIRKHPKFEELIKMISQLPKTQISIASKLFFQLGLQLSLKPEKISEIKPQKGFISNLVEFTKKLKQNRENDNENSMKVYRIFLNSLLYILMLLLCGEKQNHGNEELKLKLFQNKGFLNHFLEIQIYKHRKISKLYGIIVVHIYKQNPVFDIKKSIVHSIIRNLKHLDHEKTELNLSMILNELKFSYKLKEKLVKQQDLINRILSIYYKNEQTFQSIYTLNYLLYLVYEYPELSKNSVSEIHTPFEITENIKNFISSSKLFEKIYTRFFEWNIHQLKQDQILSINQYLLKVISEISHSFSTNNALIGTQKWIDFLLDVTKISIKSTSNTDVVLSMIDNGLINCLFIILRKNGLDNAIENKIYEVLLECISKAQFTSNQIYHSLLSFVNFQLLKLESQDDEINQSRSKMICKLKEKNQKQFMDMMELQ